MEDHLDGKWGSDLRRASKEVYEVLCISLDLALMQTPEKVKRKSQEEMFELGVAIHHFSAEKISREEYVEEIWDVLSCCLSLLGQEDETVVKNVLAGRLEKWRKKVDRLEQAEIIQSRRTTGA